jgi:predicted nuclease with TOPRIM domain
MPKSKGANKKRRLKNPNNEGTSAGHGAENTGQVGGLEGALQRLTEGVIALAEGQKHLQATVTQLVEWQQQTQGTVAQLVEGQIQLQNTVSQLAGENRRLAEGQERLWQAITQLAKGQDELQQAVTRLTEENRKLAEGQERLQETVAHLAEENRRLAEGQERLQETVAQLVGVQLQLQTTVSQLAEESRKAMVVLKEVSRKVGRLDEQLGMTVESVAQIVLPGYLERHFGIKLEGKLGYELKPMFFRLNGEWEQVDLYGEGTMGKEEICIVCECKAKIYERDVHAFVKKLERLWGLLRKRPIPVLFGYSIHPSAQEPASSHNILLISPLHR